MTVFQVKRFTTALTGSRRRKIADSLGTCADHYGDRIREWVLMIPLNPSPEELDWFEHLREPRAFPCRWHGLAQWESLVAAHPDVADYYVWGGDQRLQSAQSDMIGALELFHRARTDQTIHPGEMQELLQSLIGVLNRSDPHYSFDIRLTESDPGTDWASAIPGLVAMTQRGSPAVGFVSIGVIARYNWATVDRPIPLSATLTIPDDSPVAAQLRDVEDFGWPNHEIVIPGDLVHVETDLPGGLSEDLSGATISIAPVEAPRSERWRLGVFEDHALVATIVLDSTNAGAGRRGTRRHLRDPSGALEITLVADVTESSFSVSVHSPRDELIGRPVLEVIPVLRVLAAIRPGRSLRLGSQHGPWLQPGVPIDEEFFDADVRELVQMIDDLAFLQDYAEGTLLVPAETTRSDLVTISNAVRLLRGERIEQSWTEVSITLNEGLDPQAIAEQGPVQLLYHRDLTVEVDGVPVPLGRVARLHPSARFEASGNRPRMVPAGSNVAEEWLISESAPLPRGVTDQVTPQDFDPGCRAAQE